MCNMLRGWVTLERKGDFKGEGYYRGKGRLHSGGVTIEGRCDYRGEGRH